VANHIGLVLVVLVLVVAAFSTGAQHLHFLVYLGGLVVAVAYLGARRGLAGLEAGSWLDRRHASVGDVLTITYTLRNPGRLPRPWLEVSSPTNLPLAVPGRAIGLWPRSERTWAVRVPLIRRGQFEVDPMVVRTGDPFGLFESVASVGAGASVLVYPRVEPLPGWQLPPAPVEGSAARPERTHQMTPLATSVRPYAPGDAFSRIHWRTTARQQEIQVKEFDLEQTADLWLFLDLDSAVHVGDGDDATIETAVRAAASMSARALDDHRAVGLEAIGLRRAVLPLDRGPRQRQKLMALLAVVQPDGGARLGEMLVEGLARAQRGSVVVIVTPSLERDWVAAAGAFRARGVTSLVCVVDPVSHLDASREARGWPALELDERESMSRDLRGLRHALAEHDVAHRVLAAGVPLLPQLVAGQARAGRAT
jgi:uncharacterized protein (DUF58 family)